MFKNRFATNEGFMLAVVAGSTGSVWRLMFKMGEDGGANFLLAFVFFLLVFSGVMLAEFAIGRYRQHSAAMACEEAGKGYKWVGYLSAAACIIVASYYTAIGGYSLFFSISSVDLANGVTTISPDILAGYFNKFASYVWLPLLFQLLFIALVVFIISRGITEKLRRALLIAAGILLVALIIRCLTLAGFSLAGSFSALGYVFAPDFSKMTVKTIADAGGQALFSLMLGFCIQMTYASYADRRAALPQRTSAAVIIIFIFSMLSALVFFPAMLSYGVNPAQGPLMPFVGMAQSLSMMPMNWVFSLLFYLFMAILMLLSTLALFEVPVAILGEQIYAKRNKAAIAVGFAVFIIGVFITLGFGVWSEAKILGLSIFGALDYLVCKIICPVCVLGICAIVGFTFPKQKFIKEISGSESGMEFYYISIKFIIPLLVFAVLVMGLLP